MNILVWFNPNYRCFYNVYTNHLPFDLKVGQENGYGHILVQILVYRKNKLKNINSYGDLMRLSRNDRESLKSKIARRCIRWLNKYRE